MAIQKKKTKITSKSVCLFVCFIPQISASFCVRTNSFPLPAQSNRRLLIWRTETTWTFTFFCLVNFFSSGNKTCFYIEWKPPLWHSEHAAKTCHRLFQSYYNHYYIIFCFLLIKILIACCTWFRLSIDERRFLNLSSLSCNSVCYFCNISFCRVAWSLRRGSQRFSLFLFSVNKLSFQTNLYSR